MINDLVIYPEIETEKNEHLVKNYYRLERLNTIPSELNHSRTISEKQVLNLKAQPSKLDVIHEVALYKLTETLFPNVVNYQQMRGTDCFLKKILPDYIYSSTFDTKDVSYDELMNELHDVRENVLYEVKTKVSPGVADLIKKVVMVRIIILYLSPEQLQII